MIINNIRKKQIGKKSVGLQSEIALIAMFQKAGLVNREFVKICMTITNFKLISRIGNGVNSQWLIQFKHSLFAMNNIIYIYL